MNADVEFHIREKYVWSKLPANIKQILGDSEREYEKQIVSYSIRNQLRYKGNVVRVVKKIEKQYYEELLNYSREHLMLFPYHLSDVIVKGMRVTPFQYYCSIIQDLMEQERSYDSLPNFTAADCLRLLGIGRNQYIDLMNQCRSSKKFFRRKPIRELLPAKPVTVNIEPWWIIQVGYITEDDIKLVFENEKHVIDQIIDDGPLKAGDFNSKTVYSLYRKGLIYLDVPINDDDFIIVPPLEGFVMNRVLGDYFETLLYKIFVSIDEHTTVAELASILQIDLQLVKNAVSMYCRLGFARRKNQELDRSEIHPSWKNNSRSEFKKYEDPLLVDWNVGLIENNAYQEPNTSEQLSVEDNDVTALTNSSCLKKIAFLFDSTLTAFLMMGNLSPGLKSHAVTMFEVGKLSDESLDSLLQELDKISEIGEGEAQRYFDHALTLRSTITFLRHNKQLLANSGNSNVALGLDLIRCESLQSLDPATCARLMNKNYNILVSMAPLSNEIRPVTSCFPPHIGPAIPEVNSVWFKLFVYFLTRSGPPSLLLVKGTRIKKLPKMFEAYDRLMVTTWGHDPGIVPTSNVLITLNDALTHSAALVQGFGLTTNGIVTNVPFPFGEKNKSANEELQTDLFEENHWSIKLLSEKLDLKHTCGYITLLNLQCETDCSVKCSNSENQVTDHSTPSAMPVNGFNDICSAGILAAEIDELCDNNSSEEIQHDKCYFQKCRENWVLLDCHFGIPLFNSELNKEICKRIVTHSLCSSDNLKVLSETNRKLALQLLSFIAELQGMDPLTENIFEESVNTSEKHLPNDLPFPIKNICFHNGKFTFWQQY